MTPNRRVQVIPETPGRGRLGRHIEHDERSRAYAYTTQARALRSVRHTRRIDILDQGDIGSCTGNAAVGALGTEPLFSALPPGTALTEATAVDLYSDATRGDDFDGAYPPDDTGSSGLAVAKAAKARGLIAGYRHAFSADDALRALCDGPIICGIPWWSSFDQPSAGGRVAVTSDASIRGGHEIVFDEIDAIRKRVWFTNSWGPGWGVGGRAYMNFATFRRLLASDGDATILVPLTTPPGATQSLGWLTRLLLWLRRVVTVSAPAVVDRGRIGGTGGTGAPLHGPILALDDPAVQPLIDSGSTPAPAAALRARSTGQITRFREHTGAAIDSIAAEMRRIGAGNDGALGNDTHTYGYHLSPARLIGTGHRSDYSLAGPMNRVVDPRAGGAIDIMMNWKAARQWVAWLRWTCALGRAPWIAEIIGSVDGRTALYAAASTGWQWTRYHGDGHVAWAHVAVYRSCASVRGVGSSILGSWDADGPHIPAPTPPPHPPAPHPVPHPTPTPAKRRSPAMYLMRPADDDPTTYVTTDFTTCVWVPNEETKRIMQSEAKAAGYSGWDAVYPRSFVESIALVGPVPPTRTAPVRRPGE